MRFCVFSAQYLPHMGGVENYTYNLAKQLTEMGHQTVVVTSKTEETPEYEQMNGAEVFRLPSAGLMNGRYPVLCLNPEKKSKVIKKLKSYSFDLVIVNTRFYPMSIFGVRFGKKNRIPTIVIDHGTSHLSVHNPFFDCLGAGWEHFLTFVGRRYCNYYFGVSKATNKWLEHFGIHGNGTLYNAIDWERAQDLIHNSENNFREKNGIPHNAVIVVFTGRLIEEKGIKQLISAMEMINREREDTYLVLAGDGDLSDYVENHRSARIIPTGRIDEKEIYNLLLASDIFCLPSVSEGFPTSLLEAAVCGCYLITTERGGSKELITGSKYGTIISEGTTELVYHAVKSVLDEEEIRRTCVINTRERVHSHFTWKQTAEKVVRIAETLKKN